MMAIDESAFRPSDSYGTWSVVKNLAPLIALYTIAPILADRSVVLAWGLAPAIGLLIYRLTMVMHDCGHLTLFSSRSWNVLVGKLLGFVTGVDFEAFRQRHWEHHRDFGRAGDPQGFHYLGTQTMSRARFLWHVLKPLFGLNVRYVYSESLLSPKDLRKSVSFELAGLMAVQAVVLLLVTARGEHLSLYLLPPVSAMTFGLFFSQLRGLAEHGTRAAGSIDPHRFVRSHRADWLGAVFLYDVHFNFHAEHHRYPGVPSCRLPALSTQDQETPQQGLSIGKTLASMFS